jgi:sec-independent protein translocase protein TatA
MGEFSVYHWLVVLLIVVLLFGGRKIPELMRGLGEGIRHFRDATNGRAKSASDSQAGANPAANSSKESSA